MENWHKITLAVIIGVSSASVALARPTDTDTQKKYKVRTLAFGTIATVAFLVAFYYAYGHVWMNRQVAAPTSVEPLSLPSAAYGLMSEPFDS